jgi:hypothetical protein
LAGRSSTGKIGTNTKGGFLLRLIITAMACGALLAGCASTRVSNVDPAYRLASNGLLVASVTVSGYNPEVKRVVKTVATGPNFVTQYELESYSLR